MAIEWTVEHNGHLPMSEFLVGFGDVLDRLVGTRPAVGVVRGELTGEPVEFNPGDARQNAIDVAATDLDLEIELEIAGQAAKISVSVYPPDPGEANTGHLVGAIIGADRTDPSVAAGFAAACVLASHTKGCFFGTGLGGGVHQWHEVPDLLGKATPGLLIPGENLSALKETLWRGKLGR
ncbi:hypothetical protein LFM09_49640 [Lentzea alba]|uniref:hypothetical protein n=1 Tax=Lentzea alba TaxID=2714351 RepID=UPI0039BF9280